MDKKQLILNNIKREAKECSSYKLFAMSLLDKGIYRIVRQKCKLLKIEYDIVYSIYDIPKEEMDLKQLMLYDEVIIPRLEQLEKTESDITYELYMKRVKLESFIGYLDKTILVSNRRYGDIKRYIKIALLIRFLKSIDNYNTNIENINKLKFIEFIFGEQLDKFENKVIFGELKFGIDF